MPLDTLPLLADHTLAQLDWPAVLSTMTSQCETHYGQQAWHDDPFFAQPQAAFLHGQQVVCLQQHMARHGWPASTLDNRVDLQAVFQHVEKGGLLGVPDVVALRHWLALTRDWVHALRDDHETADLFADILAQLNAAPVDLRRKINQWISDAGEWSAQAHPELGRLLHQQKSLKHAADNHINALLQQPAIQAQLQSGQILIREGQLALAVKAVHKNSFPGELLSTSATGATVFMTPRALLPINKKLLDVDNDIALLIERLLAELTQHCVEVLPQLQQALSATAELDRRLAGARWARQQTAVLPAALPAPGHLTLVNMRHPLLDNPVPNSLTLGQPNRSLVITGPNTGGKTVLLKSVGLAVLLMRCGMPLPADKGTALSWFDAVYADIGDEQNVVQSLSTFSAHMVKLRLLTQPNVDLSRSLVLLDEIAAGTDPTEGGVLAQAVLSAIHRSGAVSVVTTHLGSLKLFANDTEGFENASVSFNADTLSPTYRLIQGVPGTSHALSIAERLGLNPQVVAAARASMNQGDRDTAGMLEQLASQQAKLQEELHKAQSYRLEAQAEFERLNEQRHKLEQERKHLLHQLKTQIRTQTRDIQDQLKRLRKRVNVEQPNPQHIDKLNQQINRVSDRTATIFTKADHPLAKLPQRKWLKQVTVGQDVYCKKLNMNMQVVAVQGDKIQVAAGLVKSYVTLRDLEPRQNNLPTPKQLQRAPRPAPPPSEPEKTFVDLLCCDVRGQGADDALAQLAQFVDQALVAGFDKISVVHGLGTGALKAAIRQELARHPAVKAYYPAQAVDGGDGKTVIELA
jgi:DNA mismatch repair protein MutS2